MALGTENIYNESINIIHETDLELNEDSGILNQPVDINNPNWQEIAKTNAASFFQKHKPKLVACAQILVNLFPLIDDKENRNFILQKIRQTEFLKNYLTLDSDCNSESNFRNNVILFILLDLGIDSRDWIIAFEQCVKQAYKNNIDVKGILEELLYLANDLNHHDMGSAKDLMNKIIKHYE